MRTLAIETSCDDTSLALVTLEGGRFVVEEMLSYSQIPLHKKYGGVVPELAARSHSEKIIMLLEEMNIDKESIDTISVTAYPGLPGALVVGITTAYMLGALWKKEVVEVNHIMGHVFSVLADRSLIDISFPYICLTVSGGHNDIYLVEETKHCKEKYVDGDQGQIQKRNHIVLGESLVVGSYTVTKLAQSNDDAAGEAFDKVSRMLGGPYPGGKWVSDFAKKYDVEMPRVLSIPPCKKGLYSLSGIKSQVYNSLSKIIDKTTDEIIIEQKKKRLAYDFQEAITEGLIVGLKKSCKEYNPKTIGIVGGVSANNRLRERALDSFTEVLLPKKISYCTDNAGMIGVVGLLQSL